jgi:hypothetical protein
MDSFLLAVPGAGIEPARPKAQDFESSASTSSATRAFQNLGANLTIFLDIILLRTEKMIISFF